MFRSYVLHVCNIGSCFFFVVSLLKITRHYKIRQTTVGGHTSSQSKFIELRVTTRCDSANFKFFRSRVSLQQFYTISTFLKKSFIVQIIINFEFGRKKNSLWQHDLLKKKINELKLRLFYQIANYIFEQWLIPQSYSKHYFRAIDPETKYQIFFIHFPWDCEASSNQIDKNNVQNAKQCREILGNTIYWPYLSIEVKLIEFNVLKRNEISMLSE